ISAHAAALRLAPPGDSGDAALHSIEYSAGHLRGLVRGMLARLRPWDEGAPDLRAALKALALETSTATTTPRVIITCDGDFDHVPPTLAASAYRIVQEALSNARQHAAADTIAIV